MQGTGNAISEMENDMAKPIDFDERKGNHTSIEWRLNQIEKKIKAQKTILRFVICFVGILATLLAINAFKNKSHANILDLQNEIAKLKTEIAEQDKYAKQVGLLATIHTGDIIEINDKIIVIKEKTDGMIAKINHIETAERWAFKAIRTEKIIICDENDINVMEICGGKSENPFIRMKTTDSTVLIDSKTGFELVQEDARVYVGRLGFFIKDLLGQMSMNGSHLFMEIAGSGEIGLTLSPEMFSMSFRGLSTLIAPGKLGLENGNSGKVLALDSNGLINPQGR